MVTSNPAVLAQLVGFGVFLWVGLYLLMRGARRTPLIVVSLIGLFSQSLFFGTGALIDTRLDAGWFLTLERWTLWTSVVPAAAWFHLSSLIARPLTGRPGQAAPPVFTPLVIVAYTAAVFLTLFGSVSDLIVDYSHALGAPGEYVIGPGTGYIYFILYLALTASGALINLVRALRAVGGGQTERDRALARQLRVLAGGALFFLLGALWISARKNWSLPISVVPGFLGLFGGLGALGYGIAHFGLLLDGQNVQRDFVYNFTGIVLLNMLYGGLLALAGPATVESALVLIALVTVTHSAFDAGRKVLDTLFFSPDERDARAEARDYATVLGTTPVAAPALAPEPEPLAPGPAQSAANLELAASPDDGPGLKEFRDQVRKALTGLKSPPQLAKSQLLALALVERRVAQAGHEDNRLNRAAALRELLIEQIEGLRPAASDGKPHRVGEAWRFYNVLYYPYVRELSRKSALAEVRRLSEERRRAGQREPGELEQVLSWLADVDEDTFYKWQRRASDTIAAILWEENSKLVQRGGGLEGPPSKKNLSPLS